MYLVQRGVVPGQVPPPVDRMTHAYENITLPQTSFAGGNYLEVLKNNNHSRGFQLEVVICNTSLFLGTSDHLMSL